MGTGLKLTLKPNANGHFQNLLLPLTHKPQPIAKVKIQIFTALATFGVKCVAT